MNVLLCLVSVDILENLVKMVILLFVYCEIYLVIEVLNSLLLGGFLIISDEGK